MEDVYEIQEYSMEECRSEGLLDLPDLSVLEDW